MSFAIDGVADEPTAFAISNSGDSMMPIPIMLGGCTTDTDAEWGRNESESNVNYIVETLSLSRPNISYGFTDAMGNAIGCRLC